MDMNKAIMYNISTTPTYMDAVRREIMVSYKKKNAEAMLLDIIGSKTTTTRTRTRTGNKDNLLISIYMLPIGAQRCLVGVVQTGAAHVAGNNQLQTHPCLTRTPKTTLAPSI